MHDTQKASQIVSETLQNFARVAPTLPCSHTLIAPVFSVVNA
jgi:hypothetical protein